MNVAQGASGAPILIEVDPELEDLIPGFLANRVRDVARLRVLVADNALEEVCRIAHSMKGSGGGYGFDAITVLGGEMELAARAGDGPKVLELTHALEDFLGRVRPVFC